MIRRHTIPQPTDTLVPATTLFRSEVAPHNVWRRQRSAGAPLRCYSALRRGPEAVEDEPEAPVAVRALHRARIAAGLAVVGRPACRERIACDEIGRASCRARVCQYE